MRFYWLKLKEGFFDDVRLKWLRSQESGDKAVLIYMKLLLKSMNTNGFIEMAGFLPIQEELALLTDEAISDIEMALGNLSKAGLIDIREDEKNLYLPELENLVGSEADSTARSREHRSKKKRLKNNDEEEELSDMSDVNDLCKPDYLDSSPNDETYAGEIDTDMDTAVDYWNQQSFIEHKITEMPADRKAKLEVLCRKYPIEKVKEAIDKIGESSFLQGTGKEGWVITFDWLIKEDNFVKVLESSYKDRDRMPSSLNSGQTFADIVKGW